MISLLESLISLHIFWEDEYFSIFWFDQMSSKNSPDRLTCNAFLKRRPTIFVSPAYNFLTLECMIIWSNTRQICNILIRNNCNAFNRHNLIYTYILNSRYDMQIIIFTIFFYCENVEFQYQEILLWNKLLKSISIWYFFSTKMSSANCFQWTPLMGLNKTNSNMTRMHHQKINTLNFTFWLHLKKYF